MPSLFARANLGLRFLGRNSFGDTEGHVDSTWTIANGRFDVAIQTEADCSAAELDSGAKPYHALPGIAHVAAVDAVVGQLPQPVTVKAKPNILSQFVGSRVVDVKSLPWLHVSNSEPYEWVVVGRIPEIMESSAELLLFALIGYATRNRQGRDLDRNRRCHRIVLFLPRVDLWKRRSGRKADYGLRNRCQTTSGTTDPGLDHCDSAWLFDRSYLRRGVLPRSFALLVAKALECTPRYVRNGRALHLDAWIADRGALRVHLRGRRWLRPDTHRLNLQHNHYAFAE